MILVILVFGLNLGVLGTLGILGVLGILGTLGQGRGAPDLSCCFDFMVPVLGSF